MSVSAVLVTRGNVDMQPIVESLPFDDIVVWDNSRRDDLGIYGRYAAIAEAKHGLIYTQDDDLLVPAAAELVDRYSPGVLTVNMPERYDIPWPSRGSVFHRDLPETAFARYRERFPVDRWFTHQACDGIFCLTVPTRRVDLGHVNLRHAFDDGRVSTSPGWWEDDRPLIQERAEALRGR